MRKALAAVVRHVDGSPQVLVFDHPLAGTQLVKGTVEDDESVSEGVIRELAEESGLDVGHPGEMIGIWADETGGKSSKRDRPERRQWHVFVVPAPEATAESWKHAATGSPAEQGLVFEFRWVPIDRDLARKLHPAFEPVARMIVAHFSRTAS